MPNKSVVATAVTPQIRFALDGLFPPCHTSNVSQEMKIIFSRAESKYIVENSETDLMLTSIGMELIVAIERNSEDVHVDASQTEYDEFLESLRDDYVWKIKRLADPTFLTNLAKRFLPDFQSLTPMELG